MEEIYTENVLVRYLYKEADFFEKLEVEHALENDQKVGIQFQQLLDGAEMLPKAYFSPSQEVVDQILFASRESSLLM